MKQERADTFYGVADTVFSENKTVTSEQEPRAPPTSDLIVVRDAVINKLLLSRRRDYRVGDRKTHGGTQGSR